MLSPITVTFQRLVQDPKIAKALPSAVCRVAPNDGECLVINRRFQADDSNVHAIVAVTVFARSFERMEALGDLVVGRLRDEEEPWDYEEAKYVAFDKLGPDVTGWDDQRQHFVRTIEFGVSW